MSEAFVTAETVTSPAYGIWIMLTAWSVKLDDGSLMIDHFEVTTSTGYRAILPACRIEHEDGVINCTRKVNARHTHAGMSVDAWLMHIRTHCHDYHLPRAEQFRDAVQETYDRSRD